MVRKELETSIDLAGLDHLIVSSLILLAEQEKSGASFDDDVMDAIHELVSLVEDEYVFQGDVYAAITDALVRGLIKLLLVLPTGSGKSFMETLIAFALAKRGKRVLVVTSRKALVDDLSQRIDSQNIEFIGSEQDESIVGKVVSGSPRQFDKLVTVTTYPSFVKMVKQGLLRPEDYDLLSLDEVHNATTDLQLETIDTFVHAGKPVVGWTATPDMTVGSVDDVGFSRVYEMPIIRGVEEGKIAPIRVSHVFVEKSQVDISGISLGKDGDFNPDELEEKIDVAVINRAVKLVWQEHCKGIPTLVFVQTRQHAEAIAKEVNRSFPGAAQAISGDTPLKVQEAIEADLVDPQNPLGLVINAEVWSEGKDLPEVKRVIVVNITRSPKSLIQKVGRGFRRYNQEELQVFEFHYEGARSLSMVDVLEGRTSVSQQVQRKEGETSVKQPELTETTPHELLAEGIKVVASIEEMIAVGSIGDQKTRERGIPSRAIRLTLQDIEVCKNISIETNLPPETVLKACVLMKLRDMRAEGLLIARQATMAALHQFLSELIANNQEGYTADYFLAHLGLKKEKIIRTLEIHEEVSPDDAWYAIDEEGKLIKRYSESIHELLEERERSRRLKANEAQEDWVSTSTLNLNSGRLHTFYQEYAELHPNVSEWKRKVASEANGSTVIVSPEFVAFVEEQKSFPPEGWLSLVLIREQYKVPYIYDEFAKLVERMHAEFPGYIVRRVNPQNGKRMYYYSPEVVNDFFSKK